ncbi:isocitrate/isopropylmalate family dehydrogenase [Psychromicrobium lacuslunae]|uniref:isocitrate/isopropylmalate family dehydrogenase n=1 Tax=Psychromicrobium lacuslunae TaxID=1618207 RepID=UPI000697737E|nr:isocitrate/isopropylmalate family dehydrogenase [Psychromicrobium lacuslunae]
MSTEPSSSPTKRRIAVLPGDGIGSEILDKLIPALDGFGLPIAFEEGAIGWQQWCEQGDPVPQRTWDLLEKSDSCLLGAVTSKPLREAEQELAPELRDRGLKYVSPVIQLRQRLGLFANVRVSEDLVNQRFRFAVIRENSEGLYAGFDYHQPPEGLWELVKDHPNADVSGRERSSASIRLQTESAMDRLFRFSFEYARKHGHHRVTVADKPNVMRYSGNHLRERFELIAAEYPEITADIHNVDAIALWMVRRPEQFGVIVAENMFGDILSDLGAGMMGGLGLAGSGNYGSSTSYFEPVHGSAPQMAGQDKANPLAMALTAAQMLSHLGFADQSAELSRAVVSMVTDRKVLTYDLGGNATMSTVVGELRKRLGGHRARPTASILTIGGELTAGDYLDSNSRAASARLSQQGYEVRQHSTLRDLIPDISDATSAAIGRDAVLVVAGGLGPTSDDITREAVAKACGAELGFDEQVWAGVVQRLHSFGIEASETNRRQAFFPKGAEVLSNPNGTAAGFSLLVRGTRIGVFPGPPKECEPMLAQFINSLPSHQPPQQHSWRLLGAVESDLAEAFHQALASHQSEVELHTVWNYPYVDVRLDGELSTALEAELDQRFAEQLVSRDGRDALAELAATPNAKLGSVSGAAAALLEGLGGAEQGYDLETSLEWQGGSETEHTGTVRVIVTVDGSARGGSRRAVFPNRGPEIQTAIRDFCLLALIHHVKKDSQS